MITALSLKIACLSESVMAQFKEERLVPLIHLVRKLSSCDIDQQSNVIQQFVRIFRCHDVFSILMDIIVSGLCQSNIYNRIPTVVFDEIQSILPSEKQLNLKDSVYESQLLESDGDVVATGQLRKKEQKLPVTFLRIPADLQCHLFWYLQIKDLMNVQKVCRALCIAARDPSALYKLEFNPYFEATQFVNECYSRPKVLRVEVLPPMDTLNRPQLNEPLIGNEKWGDHVVDFAIRDYEGVVDVRNLKPFRKLAKCEIVRSPSILLNGQITSYDTLKELYLFHVPLTEDIIDQIRKFQNVERLTLQCIVSSDVFQRHRKEPISLQKLKELAVKIENFEFPSLQRILIGSHPEKVTINVGTFLLNEPSHYLNVSSSDSFAIGEFNLIAGTSAIDTLIPLQAISEWIGRLQAAGQKFIDQSTVDLNWDGLATGPLNNVIPSVLDLFGCSKRSRLQLKCKPMDMMDNPFDGVISGICDAPFGTLTEMIVDMRFDVFNYCGRDTLYSQKVLQCLDDEECEVRDEEKVRKVLMEIMEDVDQWLTPWFVFDEARVKQIGLRKLTTAAGNSSIICKVFKKQVIHEIHALQSCLTSTDHTVATPPVHI